MSGHRQDATRATPSREGCLSAETLARAAAGELGWSERATVADHLAACADCAGELQAVAPLEAWAARSAAALGHEPEAAAPHAWLGGASWGQVTTAALLLVICAGLAAWNVTLLRENRDLNARMAAGDAPAPPPTPAAEPTAATPTAAEGLVALARPQANVPIVDLQPDGVRGAPASAGRAASVPASDALITLILNSDSRDTAGRFRLEVIDAGGRTVWSSDALRMTPYYTFTVALSPRALGAGEYRLELSRIAGSGAERLETYLLRVEG